ncbi:MAG TPA: tetratricopeptide repeat protein [Methylomirabilota bacterium]|nr:tetratricopeptide repeat protein [Methylomirabilota bacterium]
MVLLVGVPLAVFTLWPLRRHSGRRLLAVPVDAREQLLEQKRQALRALRELQFEHETGHVSDDDYAELTMRYEAEAARVLTELDQLGPAAPSAVARPAPTAARGWRHPVVLTAGALALLAFGVALGAGISRHTSPDPTAGVPMTGSRPLATLEPTPGASAGQPGAVSPEMLQGMLRAARNSLVEGRYGEAIAAYQAVLKREPRNVDAMTHLGLIVAIGGHADAALEAFDRALAIDPDYGPALLYRGQVLYERKQDAAGAIRSWERFLKVVPAGEDHERVKQLIAEAKTKK